MVFYQSICEMLKVGVCFHANWEGKGALIFLIFRHRWTNPPRRTQPLRLCFFARHNIFLIRCTAIFFCFHADWEGKGALIFGFSPRLKKFLPYTCGRQAFASLR